MADRPKRTPTQQIEDLGGPAHYVRAAETKLAQILADVLEKRHAVKRHMGRTADEAEAEIKRICASFVAAAHADIRQVVMDSYGYNRYVKTEHRIAPDAGRESEAVALLSPEIKLKPTLPYGQPPAPVERERLSEPEILLEDEDLRPTPPPKVSGPMISPFYDGPTTPLPMDIIEKTKVDKR